MAGRAFIASAVLVAGFITSLSKFLEEHDEESSRAGHQKKSMNETGYSGCVGNPRGKTKALLVAFEYHEDMGELKGTCYDMYNMVRFVKTQGYQEIRYFTDKCTKGENVIGSDWSAATRFVGKQGSSYKARMRNAFKWLLNDACPGDALLFHYSGHGSIFQYQKPAMKALGHLGKDECTGSDSALFLPEPSQKTWSLTKRIKESYYKDNDLLLDLAMKVPQGVHLFAIIDACHSGTIFDLPWNWMSQKYYYTCPADAEKRTYEQNQFVWEWALAPADLNRSYPLNGLVTVISGSQDLQYSRDGNMKKVEDKAGTKHNAGGALTHRLVLDLKNEPVSQLLVTAEKWGWSWARTMSEVVRQVAGETNEHRVTGADKQIPNFASSHRSDMGGDFTLDASALVLPSVHASSAEMQCSSAKWLKTKGKLKKKNCN